MMFFPEGRVRVWLYGPATDMRKQFDGLAALAKQQMSEDPLAGHLFVFVNRRLTQVKVLYFDGDGYCLWSKRLERGRFRVVPERGAKQALSMTDLRLLLAGIEVDRVRRYKRFQRPEGCHIPQSVLKYAHEFSSGQRPS